jgi:pyruvate/2-oxoglutarate dehydrogenase complex dihydrolipoamide dehydrogenase (E3) component
MGPVDLVVVGGGSAGLVAAKTAAGLGAGVVLVERDRPGGDCLWTGCVPSKALLAAARRAHDMRDAGRVGLRPVTPTVEFPAVMAAVHAAVTALEPPDSPAALKAAGVEVVSGTARFTGSGQLTVDGERLAFGRAVIATGAQPVVPEVPGLTPEVVLTSDTVWDLEALPDPLLVLGGGAVGCELAQAFARLGARVVLVEAAERLLPVEPPAASAVVAAALAADGLDVRTATTLERVTTGRDGVVATLRADGQSSEVEVQRVLVAVGRRPDVAGLAPQSAGVAVGDRGEVRVDERLRTTHPRVFAAGDVTGGLALTHVAGVQGSIAATNALLGPWRRWDPRAVPWVTFTDPEVARVGLTEDQARAAHGAGVRARHVEHAHLDRAVIEGATAGFTEVVLDRRGRVLGACVVAPRAGEMLAELTALVARRGRLRELAGVVHPYPGWSDGPWRAALDEVTATTRRPLVRGALAAVLGARRYLGDRTSRTGSA